MLCMTLARIGKKGMVKTKGMLHICNDHANDSPSMWKYVKQFWVHKVPPVLQKVCRKLSAIATLAWICYEVMVKMIV